MDWNIFWTAVGAVCVFTGMIAGGGALFVRMSIHNELNQHFADFMKEIREEFISKDGARYMLQGVVKDELKQIWRIVERRKNPRVE